ncbi:6-phosphogluconate dehydrogenase [Aequorivita sp. H23M31]|uniref:6-phosphogluconate dehydrogenase n=1 Tax=Aequorivita ciconiae TaxID=2494375 RepID=A0A410G6Y3_9FLAO|nr:6-phosphogluconate dehydrogenase [Aequorivita sp. H23M31]QAA83058.1 6-phosphogluconate dehydrogenase [Aequorivita sp. H23M31]
MKKFIIIFFGAVLVITAVFFAFVYYVPYSEGTRAGELIQFSHRGVLIKTWEGEISQGISGAQIFSFSVLDEDKDVIDKLKEYQGSYVKVTYVQRYTSFAIWGETKFFVTSVEKENSSHFNRDY